MITSRRHLATWFSWRFSRTFLVFQQKQVVRLHRISLERDERVEWINYGSLLLSGPRRLLETLRNEKSRNPLDLNRTSWSHTCNSHKWIESIPVIQIAKFNVNQSNRRVDRINHRSVIKVVANETKTQFWLLTRVLNMKIVWLAVYGYHFLPAFVSWRFMAKMSAIIGRPSFHLHANTNRRVILFFSIEKISWSTAGMTDLCHGTISARHFVLVKEFYRLVRRFVMQRCGWRLNLTEKSIQFYSAGQWHFLLNIFTQFCCWKSLR